MEHLTPKLMCVSDDVTAANYIKLFGTESDDSKPFRTLTINLKPCHAANSPTYKGLLTKESDDCLKEKFIRKYLSLKPELVILYNRERLTSTNLLKAKTIKESIFVRQPFEYDSATPFMGAFSI